MLIQVSLYLLIVLGRHQNCLSDRPTPLIRWINNSTKARRYNDRNKCFPYIDLRLHYASSTIHGTELWFTMEEPLPLLEPAHNFYPKTQGRLDGFVCQLDILVLPWKCMQKEAGDPHKVSSTNMIEVRRAPRFNAQVERSSRIHETRGYSRHFRY